MSNLWGTGILNPTFTTTLPDPFPSFLLDYMKQHGQAWAGTMLDFMGGAKVSPGHQLSFPSSSIFSGHNITERPSPALQMAQDSIQHDLQLYPWAAQTQADPWQSIQADLPAAIAGTLDPGKPAIPLAERLALFGAGPIWGESTWGSSQQPFPTTQEGITPDFVNWLMGTPANLNNAEFSILTDAASRAGTEGIQESMLRQRLAPYQLSQPDEQKVVDYFNAADWGALGGAPGGYQYTRPDDPLLPFYKAYYGDAAFQPAGAGTERVNLWTGTPGHSDIRRLGADLTNAPVLGQDLAAAGLTNNYNLYGTDVPLNTGGTPVSDATTTNNPTGQQLSPLNPMSPYYTLFGGGYYYTDDKGVPHFVQQTPEQWQQVYGTSGLFGPQSEQAIRNILSPLPLSAQEQVSRDLLSGDQTKVNAALAKYPELKGALDSIHQTLLPSLQELATTGFATKAPQLFDPNLMSQVQDFSKTGNRKALEDAANVYMQREIGPKMAAQYAGQLGSFGTDFGGELANQSRLFSADIANTVNANEKYGMGMWGDMTSQQGLLASNLAEAAATRRATGLPLYQQAIQLPYNLQTAAAKDLADIGGAYRQTDELLQPGYRTLDILRQLTTGAAPGNIGYVAQGATPSDTAQLLNGLAGQSANFGAANLAGLGTNFLGSLLNSPILSGGGSGNFGLAGDLFGGLGNLLSRGAGALFNGISGLFGGGGSSAIPSSAYTPNNYGGSDSYYGGYA